MQVIKEPQQLANITEIEREKLAADIDDNIQQTRQSSRNWLMELALDQLGRIAQDNNKDLKQLETGNLIDKSEQI